MDQKEQGKVLKEIAEHTGRLNQGTGPYADASQRALEALQGRAEAARRTYEGQGWKTDVFTATVQWRLVARLGAASVLEGAGMTLHRIYGLPYLPGSSLKGLVRHYLWLNGHMEKDDPLIVQIFGSEEGRGGVIFSDAFPEKWPALELDITNVHYPQYYGKEVWQEAPVPPADYLSPKPVYFLTVTSGTAFRFNLRAMKADILEQVGRYAREAIELLGLEAKTHAGYGGMTVTDA